MSEAPSVDLLLKLQALEIGLHQPDVRADRGRVDRLLHPDFFEYGRSGTIWTRAATLEGLSAGLLVGSIIHAQDFELNTLGDAAALLTYRSAHVGPRGERDRWSLRSSLWQRDGQGQWQLRFHQGTPTEAP